MPATRHILALILALGLRPLTFSHANALPAGPTALVFALLAQYVAAVPTVYKWRVVTGTGAGDAGAGAGVYEGEGEG